MKSIKLFQSLIIERAGVRFLLLILCFGAFPLCAVQTGQRDRIHPETISASEQRKLDYFFYEGLILKNAGKQDAAYEVFKHCLSIDSTASAVLFELSSLYLQTERPEKAASLLKQAVTYDPDNFTYKVALASLSFNLGMYGEASAEYEELVRAYPEKVELNYYLAESLTQEGEIGKAIDTFDALENAIGMSEALSMQKYKLYMALKQPEKAFNELRKLAAKYPADARYPILIGDLFLEEKNSDQALEYYRKAYAIDPENPYYTVSMANYYESTGNPEAAEEQIRSALVNEKLDVEIKVGILARYIQQLQHSRNETAGANALFQTLLEQHPEDIELKLMYGSLLAHQHHTDEARFQFQLVTEMAPDHERAWQQLLSLSLQSRDPEEAIRVCRRCLELFPNEPEYYFYMGIACFQLKKYQEALEAYYAGLKIIPEENRPLRSDFYGQIGDIHYQMKQSDKAFAAYDEALRYNERNVVVLNNYGYFLSLEKKELDRAERMSAQCIKLEPDNATYLDTYAWIFFVKGNYLLAKIYIENALEKDTTRNPELLEHYGDILYMTGDKEKALQQWQKAKELGKESRTLERKIAEKTYFEETPDNEE
jgi:tetratricopeptide (TPR) repeat protein